MRSFFVSTGAKLKNNANFNIRYTMKENLRLLIVDDDADDRKFFKDAVREINETIECSVAKDGLDALQLLEDAALPLPHFIFLDLRMPRFDGRKALLKIKENNRLKKHSCFNLHYFHRRKRFR